MTAVLDPTALTGFHEGSFRYSTEDEQFYLLTSGGAIPADESRILTTLDADQLVKIGSDHATYRDSQVDLLRPSSPVTVGDTAFEGLMLGTFFAGGVSLSGASGFAGVRKRMRLNFLSGGALDSRITFTRASSATRVNASGLIETVGTNVARIDYDPVTLACKGLLIEEARTNLCLYSDDFTNAAWTKTNATTAKTATGPDGAANSATTLTATAGNATALQAITSASAARITSCWIKRRTGTGNIDMTQDNGATWATVTVTSSWTRVNIASATLANPTVGLRIVTNGDAVDVALFQQEVGGFITSAIPTTSATVTRAADVARMTGTNFSSWYNATQGTFVVGFDTGVHNGQYIIGTSSTDTSGMFSNVNIAHWNGTAILSDGAISYNYAANKAALAYTGTTSRAIVINGGTVASAATTAGTRDQLTLGYAPGSNYLNGHIKFVSYFPQRLSDAQLVSLTV